MQNTSRGMCRTLSSVSGPRHKCATKELSVTIILARGLHQDVKYTYYQITYFYNHETKTITAPTPNFRFVPLRLLKRTDRIYKMIERL